jgi:hypothetical protein
MDRREAAFRAIPKARHMTQCHGPWFPNPLKQFLRHQSNHQVEHLPASSRCLGDSQHYSHGFINTFGRCPYSQSNKQVVLLPGWGERARMRSAHTERPQDRLSPGEEPDLPARRQRG